jgi:predicted negative regulator of RcsB-dependent stress response
MEDNVFETQYDVTKKSRLIRFYEANKFFIFSSLFIILIILFSTTYYFSSAEKKKILLSENYISAKISIENGNKDVALNILKKITFENDPTYSTLSFFLILDQNLISDDSEILILYDHLLENNKFNKEFKNLLIYKKALFSSNFISESDLLESTKILLNSDSLWKPHALLLLGDYFVSKGESIKAIEFYQQILSINNLNKDFYQQAKSQLDIIANE